MSRYHTMKYLLFALCLGWTSLTLGQSIDAKLKPILAEVIAKTKEISMYAHTVDWEELEKEIYQTAEAAKEVDDLKPALEIMLNGLRDHHGTIRKTSDYSILAHFTDYAHSRNQDDREFDPATWAIVNDVESRFEYAVLPNRIGYLKVVGIGPQVDGQTEAERIRNAIQELHDQEVDQWIVDLRYNGGGNINVMMAGLAPLFDDGKIIGVHDGRKTITGWGEVDQGNFSYFQNNVFPMNNQPELQKPKVAILTSRWTVSSGEMVAIAFKGQEQTRIFGEKTGGMTTNNSWDVIQDELALIISTGIFCDRHENLYPQHVAPDVEIPFAVETDKEQDPGILAALKWLGNQ